MGWEFLLGAILGSAGLFSLIQFLISRKDSKNDKFVKISNQLDKLGKTQEETILRITRIELLSLIREDPENIDAILQVAEKYFIELDGNAYAHAIFLAWAKRYGVDTGWLPKINRKRKE